MLKEHGMDNLNAVRCLLPKNAYVMPANENDILTNEVEHKKYRAMVLSYTWPYVLDLTDHSPFWF